MHAIFTNRLVHFVLLGGAIFAIAPRSDDARRIELRSSTFDSLAAAEAQRRSLAALTSDKAREVRARAIEDEVLFREALRLGLDRDDPIVRQRLAQKLLLLVEDLGGASQSPTDAELRAFFDEDPARWRRAQRTHFVHVFATRAEMLSDGSPGEAFPYSRDVTGSREDIARVYGAAFADAVVALSPSGALSAPVQSTFGWHRVRVIDRERGRVPAFEEARDEIVLDYMLARRERVVGAYLKKTVAEYAIVVDGAKVTDFVPTRRIAVRTDPSAED